MSTPLYRSLPLSIGLCVAAGGLVGCDAVNDILTPTDSEEARIAVESMALTRLEASLVMAIAEQTPLDLPPEEMAAAVEAAAPMIFSPADCVRAETAGATVTMDLTGCSGPRGLALTGVVNAAYSVDGDTVTINVAGVDIEIGEATMAINANGTYEVQAGGGHRAALSTQGVGTAPGGTVVGRLGQYEVTWDGACFAIDGEWSSSLDDEIFVTTVSDFYVCEAYCPASGSIIYGRTEGGAGSDDVSGSVLTISYIGDSGAPWVSTDGSFGRQELDCAEDPQSRDAPGGDDDDIDLD